MELRRRVQLDGIVVGAGPAWGWLRGRNRGGPWGPRKLDVRVLTEGSGAVQDLLTDGFVHGAERLAAHQQPQGGEEEEAGSLHPAGAAGWKQEAPSQVSPFSSGESGPQRLWELEPWVPVGDRAGSPALSWALWLGLWVEAGAADTYPLDALRRPNLGYNFLGPLKASGCGASCLGLSSLALWHFLPTSWAKRKPLGQTLGPRSGKFCHHPPSKLPPFNSSPHIWAGTGPGGGDFGMIPERIVQRTGRETDVCMQERETLTPPLLPQPDPHPVLSVSVVVSRLGVLRGGSDGICPSTSGLFTEHGVLKVRPQCSRCQDVLPF